MLSSPTLERPVKNKTPRRFERHRVDSLMYVGLGPDNGGFPINISEGGMAFQGIRPLEIDQEISITLRLEGVAQPVTATARIVWLTASRKAGGLQFLDLPEASRRLIKAWVSGQQQGGGSKNGPGAAISPDGAKGRRSAAPTVPLPADGGKSTVRAGTVAATQACSRSLSVPDAAPLVAPVVFPVVTPKAELEVTARLSKQTSPATAKLIQLSVGQTHLKANKKTHSRIGWSGFAWATAASIAILIGSSLIVRPFRKVLLVHSDRTIPAQTDAAPVSVPDPLPLPEPPAALLPSIEPADIESPLPAPLASEEHHAIKLDLSNVKIGVLSHPSEIPAPRAPQNSLPHEVTTKVSASPALDARLALPATIPAQSDERATPQLPQPVSGGTTQLSDAGAAEGKASSSPIKLPENSVLAAGSIEAISDPYPSIRVPADSQKRLSQPGTSLRIGRLISKIDPVYPQEALRQRLAGTVKVHIIIGRNGTIQKAELLDGPSLLAQAVLPAVQQWRYEPTILGGEEIETEEDITMVFRITTPPLPSK